MCPILPIEPVWSSRKISASKNWLLELATLGPIRTSISRFRPTRYEKKFIEEKPPLTIQDIQLLVAFFASVFLLILLIAKYGISPILALILASILLAIAAGLPLTTAMTEFSGGVGAVLGSTAMVIALGAMIGILLQKSGGATEIAQRLIGILGEKNLSWTMVIVGLLVGVGVWFTVGLVLLVPIAFSLSKVAKVGVMIPGMSMLAGLSAMHGFAPPHPGPLAAIALLEADLGSTILWSLVVGSISAILAGPVYWHFFKGTLAKISITAESNISTAESNNDLTPTTSPGFLGPLTVILLPIMLMLLASFIDKATVASPESLSSEPTPTWISVLSTVIVSAGIPTIAMLIGLMLAIAMLGWRCGMTTREITKMTEASLYPVANVLLVVGAGAGFSKILIASGVGQTLADLAIQVPLPTLVLAWLIAAAFRVATGSATTAITAAGGIASVIVAQQPDIDRQFMVLALGAGSLTLSHVNDGGFWFVKEYFGLTVTETLKTWTVLETVLSLVALLLLLILDAVF